MLLRLFWIIPIYIILSLVNGATGQQVSVGKWPWDFSPVPGEDSNLTLLRFGITAGGLLFVPVLLMLLFRKKYPRWWFDWNVSLYRFSFRVMSYFLLLRDEYPSTDEEQAVHLDIKYPDADKDLNRWLPLVKWVLAIPHAIVLFFLYIAVFVLSVLAWFSIVFAGTHPRAFFDFVVGVNRWTVRVYSYAFLLTTDKYPPFSLD